MLLIRRPSDEAVREFIESQKQLEFSYPEVGCTRGVLPSGYQVDRSRIKIGTGAADYARVVAAVRSWKMFEIEWLVLRWPDAPVEPGSTVAVLANLVGLWSLNACRVVYTFDETSPVRQCGFAIGTLPQHAERGEERFSAVLHADNSVWYEFLAVSRPNQWSARIAHGFSRRVQQRFRRDSLAAIVRSARL